MEHLALLEYIAGLVTGFMAVGLLVFYSRLVGRKDIRWLAAAIIVQNLRVLLFAFSYYTPAKSLAGMPDPQSLRTALLLIYYCLVAVHGAFILAWLGSRLGGKIRKRILPPYSALYGTVLLTLLLIEFAISSADYRYQTIKGSLALFAVLFDKLAIVVVASLHLHRQLGSKKTGSSQEIIALAALILAAVADGILPLLGPSLLAILGTMLPYYAVPFLVLAGLRREIGGSAADTPQAANLHPTPVSVAALSARLAISEEEAGLVSAILQGRSNKELAWESGLSLSAVKHRLFALYKKLGVASRFELISLVGRTFSRDN